MAWSVFLPFILVAYTAYYALNILYDLLVSRRRKGASADGVQYSVSDLMAYEEQPTEVTYAPYEEDYVEDLQDDLEYEEDYQDPESYEEAGEYGGASAPIDIAPVPTLKVEGQGIPLEQFIREAKSYSSTIF